MVPVAEFLKLGKEERQGKYPYIWTVDRKNRLGRVLVAKPLIEACDDRLNFWHMLKALAGIPQQKEESKGEMAERIKSEVVQNIASGLTEMASGAAAAAPKPSNGTTAQKGGYVAPSLDSGGCTACNECVSINPSIFAYNAEGKAYIKNAQGGPYKDLVKAAEKCAAGVIQPGLPEDRSNKELDSWMKRAEKYNSAS
jgi:pyruvate-ferredoxin/flavodoxin oxidoreductase